ncbi:hypothetical protein [Jiella avicenniae]|uniref:Uncharacterized protein n=1 Tax=Jiella avicenniae TaxID=2907202 RepID=A0A9X1T5R0_9HYPH|nr:hypothetical protein [Jiella avicenniae]MCE7028480.1 hypothetical protein [Jiella avicenniae]
MPYPVWPAELPQYPSENGYQRGARDGRSFTKPQNGPPKIRRRTSAAVKPVSVTFRMDTNQLARFERFFEEDTGGGLMFVMPDAAFHGQPLLTEAGQPLLTETGKPILISAWWLVVFDEEAPLVTDAGWPFYDVSFSVLVWP